MTCYTNLLLHSLLFLLSVSVSVSTTETEWRQAAFFTDVNGTPGDFFGLSVAIDDGIVVVGAPENDMAASGAGAVYIYSAVDGEWSEEAVITASDAASFDSFGVSVAISNGTVVVGAFWDDNLGGSDAGAVYVYVRQEDGSWTEQAKLLASDADDDDRFGLAVAIHGSTLTAGAPRDSDRGTKSGSVYVFKHEDGSWTEHAKLIASDGSAEDYFGSSLSVYGDWMVIGSLVDDDLGESSGSAYLFEHMADGSWTEQAKFVASDGEAGDRFGLSVDIFGDTVAVGSPDHGDSSGAAYLFKIVSGAWTEQAKLLASDPTEGGQFGSSLSLADNSLVVGVPGGFGYTSFWTSDAVSWTDQARLAANGTVFDDRFGQKVAFDQDTVVISLIGYNYEQGAVYIYEALPLTPEPSGFLTQPPTEVPTYEPTVAPSSSMFEPSAFPTTTANPECKRVVIDFEEYAAGDRPFNLGYGVRVRGDGQRARHGVMTFDTANPTGEDKDLASEDLGNILILSEDGDATDPDDNMLGGYIRFTFKPPISEVISIDLKDFDAQGSSITGKYADGSVFATIAVDPSENGGEQTLMIGESNVGRLKINLAGSGGIDNLTLIYCEP